MIGRGWWLRKRIWHVPWRWVNVPQCLYLLNLRIWRWPWMLGPGRKPLLAILLYRWKSPSVTGILNNIFVFHFDFSTSHMLSKNNAKSTLNRSNKHQYWQNVNDIFLYLEIIGLKQKYYKFIHSYYLQILNYIYVLYFIILKISFVHPHLKNVLYFFKYRVKY